MHVSQGLLLARSGFGLSQTAALQAGRRGERPEKADSPLGLAWMPPRRLAGKCLYAAAAAAGPGAPPQSHACQTGAKRSCSWHWVAKVAASSAPAGFMRRTPGCSSWCRRASKLPPYAFLLEASAEKPSLPGSNCRCLRFARSLAHSPGKLRH